MILDKNDPTGVGLFSKCARNHAHKQSAKKYSSTKQQKKTNHLTYSEKAQKKTICSFDMIQTREQRLKKQKPQQTPSVGQYNPKVQTKVKLTWDILKIHHNKTIKRSCPQPKEEVKKVEEVKEKSIKKSEENEGDLSQTFGNNQSIMTQKLQVNNSKKQQQKDKQKSKNILENRRYETVKSMTVAKSQVDMSRMTGRQQKRRFTTEEPLSGDETDLNKSVQFVKHKMTKNIYFKKQITREKINSLQKRIVVPSDYNCDMNLVKKKVSGLVKFTNVTGRNNKRSMNLNYSYTHYDYDNYVWKGRSKIYPNTKTSISNFSYQTNRNGSRP